MKKHYRIVYANREKYTLDDGRSAVLAGRVRYSTHSYPVTGDIVEVSGEGDNAVIENIQNRSSELRRKNPSGEGMQTMAANVTHVLIVMAMDANFSLRRLERFMVLARSADVIPVVALTKADIVDPVRAAVLEREAAEITNGAVFVTSTVTWEGVEELKSYFGHSDIICLAGLSGAGKSSLLNAMYGEEVMKTSQVRESDEKGVHTTTVRYMVQTPSGCWIMDMPGIKEVGIGADADAVSEVFDDIEELSIGCKFADCTHQEEPGCAVKQAVEEGIITAERLKSYLKLMEEADAEQIKLWRRQKDKRISKLAKEAAKHKKR